MIAAAATIWAVNKAATREVSAAQEQTRVAQTQIAITLRLEKRRIAREFLAFFAMLEAATGAVVDDIESARGMFAGQSQNTQSVSALVYQVRQRVKKTAFEDIRNACLKFGGQLTAPFLRLDKEIDGFSAQWTLMPTADRFMPSGSLQIRTLPKFALH